MFSICHWDCSLRAECYSSPSRTASDTYCRCEIKGACMARVNEFPTAKAHETNVEKVVQLEAEQEKHVAPANRLSEAIARFAGTNAFVFVQLVCVALWIAINT